MKIDHIVFTNQSSPISKSLKHFEHILCQNAIKLEINVKQISEEKKISCIKKLSNLFPLYSLINWSKNKSL